MSKVIIEDIQIRLTTEVEDVTFVCSWWGPRDKMRFAGLRYRDRELEPEEAARLEDIAKARFTKKIDELEKKL